MMMMMIKSPSKGVERQNLVYSEGITNGRMWPEHGVCRE